MSIDYIFSHRPDNAILYDAMARHKIISENFEWLVKIRVGSFQIIDGFCPSSSESNEHYNLRSLMEFISTFPFDR